MKKMKKEYIPNDNFTKEFVNIMQKQTLKKPSRGIIDIVLDIRDKQKPQVDEKDEIDHMIIEDMKKFNSNSINNIKFRNKAKDKLDSMDDLIDIPKVEYNFNTPFDENIYNNNFPTKVNQNLNDSFKFNLTKFCSRDENKKSSICKNYYLK